MLKIGRNDLCPCGSEKKFKKCCIDKDVETVIKENYVPYFTSRIIYEEIDDMSNDEIIDLLNKMGIPFDQAAFLQDVERYHSADEISETWFKKYSVRAMELDEDFPWFAAWVLWERLAPEHILSLEQLDDLIQLGYKHVEEDDSIAACDVWLEVWEALKYRIKPRFKDMDYLDRKYMGAFFIRKLCQDLEAELYHAGLTDSAYFEKRIKFCQQFCNYFPRESELIVHNMKRAIGESYAKLNLYELADTEFKKLVLEYPNNPWGYIGWGDIYFFEAMKDDERAKELYERGVAIAKDDSDVLALKERLEDLQSII